jgi:ATP-binding cassette subfamily B protein
MSPDGLTLSDAPARPDQAMASGGNVLELDDLWVSYGGMRALSGVSLVVPEGSVVALLGPNGAGKSTIVSLMLGLYRPGSGRLLADGIPYDELDMHVLRRQIGVVLQDPIILPGSIAENIAYGHADATMADIRRAAEWSTAAGYIEALPQGYETQAGDEGSLLSGGQRQRIAIARALIADPALLILDEPTTYLDEASIRALTTNLNALPGGPSVLIVTHDPEAARGVDSVARLRDGRIVSQPHEVVRPRPVADTA